MLQITRESGRNILIVMIILGLLSFYEEVVEADDELYKPSENKALFLSLKEGIAMVLEKNLDITIKRITPEIEETKVEKEKGAFDPELSFSFNRKDTKTPLNSRSALAAGGATNSKSETLNLDSKVKGKTNMGTTYEIGFDNRETKSTFNSFDPEYDAFAGIVITQPLLKDYGSDSNLFQIRTAEKDRKTARHDLKSLVIDKIAEFETAYWDIVLSIEDLKVKEESLRLAESLLDRNRKKLNAGVISPLEVTQAEAGAASRKEGVIIGKRDVENKKNKLKRFISSDLFALRGVDIIPTNEPPTKVVTIDLNQSIESALRNRPEYLKAKIDIDKKDIKVKFDRNQLFPRVDLEASYGFNGFGESIGDSVEDLSDNDEWLLGIAIKYPFGNRKAKGDLTISKLEAKRALLDLKNVEQDIILQIEDAVREVRTNIERIKATKVSTKLATEALKAEELKLNAGISTSHNVLEFQEKLAKARSDEIKAIIEYNESLVEHSKHEGTILEKNNIFFSDDLQ